MKAMSPELDAFILSVAPPHEARADAPQSFAELQNWMSYPSKYFDDGRFLPKFKGNCFREVGTDLVARIPVWNGASDDSIYGSAEVNYAYRAWHDSTHLRLGLGFDLDSERQVALQHVRDAWDAGLSVESIELLWIDSQGQNEYYRQNSEFVGNQREFARVALAAGIHAACQRVYN